MEDCDNLCPTGTVDTCIGSHGSIVPDTLMFKIATEGIKVFCLIDVHMFNISIAISLIVPMGLNI